MLQVKNLKRTNYKLTIKDVEKYPILMLNYI